MELRILRYFLVLAREENITKAAEFLHITQPTLSRQLMQLEDELHTRLFIRGKNKISLTEEGMLLRRRAEEIIDLTDKTEKEFLQQDELITGEIFIGGAEINTMHLLAKSMKEFQKQYPHVQYHLYSGNADDVKEKIDKGLIDIGVLLEPVNIEKYDFICLPQKEVWGVVVPKDNIIAKQGYATPKDLLNAPLMISTRSIVHREIANWLGQDFTKLNIVSTFNLINNAAIMVEEGIGYAITLDKLIYINDERSICFVPFRPKLETGTVIVWKKHQVFSPTTTKFIKLLQDKFSL